MMKPAVLPLFIAASAALVLPEPPEAPLTSHVHSGSDAFSQLEEPFAKFWDGLYKSGSELHDSIATSVDDSVDYLKSSVESAIHAVDDVGHRFQEDLSAAIDSIEASGHDHEFPDSTIYDLIKKSKYTTKFAKLVDEHEDIVKILDSTKSGNLTLFVPIDEAFEKIPDDHEKPGKEFVEAFLKYHIGIGEYRARTILGTNTIPSALDEKWLGDEPQRLRTGVSLSGVNVNFYSKVVAADIGAKNGVIHAVRSILVPPPMIGRILTLFPSEFSTLLLAYEKTDFVKFIHGVKMTGSTVFAPSNKAFSYLGPKVNAFLFNTEKGLKYLKALLKYHIAPDVTLYSDAIYDKTGEDDDGDDEANAEGWKREHFDLGTLLRKTHVGVDTATFAGFTIVKVNGFSNVLIRDAPGKNGVIHVVDQVLVPPCKHNSNDQQLEEDSFFGEMTVEQLMERLDPYIEETDAVRPDDFEL